MKKEFFSKSSLKQSHNTNASFYEIDDLTPQQETPAPNFMPMGEANVARKPLRPADVLALQRTIGNRAVQRLLKHHEGRQAFESLVNHTSAQPKSETKPTLARQTTGSGVIQRLPSSRTFEKGWDKKTAGAFKADVFSAHNAEQTHKKADKKEWNQKFHGMEKADILAAYQVYDRKNSKDNLSELFHAVTYWETLNHIHSTEPWHQPAMEFLGELKESIKSEMQAKVDKAHGKNPRIINAARPFQKVPWSRANQTSKIKSWSAEKAMPQFLKEVGLSSQYFNANLDGKPEQITALYDYYLALKSGSRTKSANAYDKVKNLPNMAFIKPLFVVHFAGKMKMDNVFGTDAQSTEGQALTPQEMNAITYYSGGEYKTMNEELRNTGSKKRATLDPNANAKATTEFNKKKTARENTVLAVSGLNKMPKFSGTAYRGYLTEPATGYLDLVQPGALMVDLAFSSASSSFQGARHFLNSSTQPGTKYIYIMIHSKTAVNIVEHSHLKKEGEVLFRPGTKFQVKALWEHVKGKVPRNAPPEAQLMLQSLGPAKAVASGNPFTDNFITGKSAKEIEEQAKDNPMYSPNDEQKKKMTWNSVKVIEVVEV